MTRYLFRFTLASLFMLSTVCYGNADRFEFQPSAGISWEINKDWTMNYREELHLNDGGGTLYYGHSDIGVVYKSLAEWLDFGVNYTVIYGIHNNARSTDENRTSLSTIMRGKILNHDFSDRIRIEYRDRDQKSDIWRFRNKFTLDRKFELLDPRGNREISKWKIKPYFSDEIYDNLDGTGFSENDFNIGTVIKLTENISLDIYYSFQTVKSDEKWSNNNVIGMDFTYYF